jgi:hypothetical protein
MLYFTNIGPVIHVEALRASGRGILMPVIHVEASGLNLYKS